MKLVLVSLILSVLVVDLESAKTSANIPDWVRRQMRRSRRRQGTTSGGCDTFTYGRCLHGTCYLNDDNTLDDPSNFVNAKAGKDFFCDCAGTGYETYYPGNSPTNMPPDDPKKDFCNAEQDPCRQNPKLCKGASDLNQCVHSGPNQFECKCNPFWTGYICEKDVDECSPCNVANEASCPCKNDARCENKKQSKDDPYGFKCTCKSGTTGEFCEKINNPCERKPCLTREQFGGAVVSPKVPCRNLAQNDLDLTKPTTLLGYECECKENWGGQNCEMRKGKCVDNPCGGKGQCIADSNYDGFYKCICNAGYENLADELDKAEGKFCTKVTDMCDPNPCYNGGVCLTLGANQRECVCKSGYTGPQCESFDNPCVGRQGKPKKARCLNKGVCSPKANSGTQFDCDCKDTGYDGPICENDIDECAKIASPCSGNGECTNTDGSYECKCNPGYSNTADEKCKAVESLCDLEPDICQFKGDCTKKDNINENFQCSCSFVKIDGKNVLAKGSSTQICDAAAVNDQAQLSSPMGLGPKIDVSSISGIQLDKDTQAAFKTRGGGILNNQYWNFVHGSAKLETPRNQILPGAMIIYFKTTTPTYAHLLTVWDNGRVLSICPSPNKRNFIVKIHKLSVEIELPRHSLKSWNNIVIKTLTGPPRVEVYLNTAFVASKEVTAVPEIKTSASIYYGTDVNNDGAATGPKFSGGIGDLFYFEPNKQPNTVKLLMDNILKLNSPECKPYLDLRFEQPDIYRDSGCMLLDPVPEVEEMRSKVVKAPNGKFPLVFFNSPIDNSFMKKYLKPMDQAQILVPSFSALFNADDDSYGMTFRFRPNFDGLKIGAQKYFARSKKAGDDSKDVIKVGTRVDSQKTLYFQLCLGTDLEEEKCLQSKLDTDASADDFCKDCIWSVVVNWNKILAKSDNSEENIEISNMFEGKITKTSYSIKGRLTSATALEIGVDKAHEVGPMRIAAGVTFKVDTETFLKSKGAVKE